MGSVVVDVEVRGPRGRIRLRSLVDTGFYGDIITAPEKVEGLGIDFKYERPRKLPNGEAIRVRYGGEIRVVDSITYGDIEVWPDLKLPAGVDALLGVTALEKLGFRVDPRTGKLEKIELYLTVSLLTSSPPFGARLSVVNAKAWRNNSSGGSP